MSVLSGSYSSLSPAISLRLIVLAAVFFLAACADSGTGGDNTDGDTDFSENEMDMESSVTPCSTYDLGLVSGDASVIDAAAEACRANWWHYPGAEACYANEPAGDGTQRRCCPTHAHLEAGTTIVCESRCGECEAGEPEDSLQWPGPGFGCFRFSGRFRATTGWHTLPVSVETMEGPNGCLNSWTESKLALILDRDEADPTPCEDIGDLAQCITTDNAPAHCQAILAWPLDMLDAECRFEAASQLTGQAELDRAQFIGCKTRLEYEPSAESDDWYAGLIRSDASAPCLYYEGPRDAIPSGWLESDCASCR